MPSYRGISPEINGGANLGSQTQMWGKVYANHVLTAGSLYRRRTRKTFTLADLEAAVADGDYAARDIAPGDYYEGASGYTYIFAGDNPMKGDHTYTIQSNHAGLIVLTHETSKWNNSNDTTGGYVSSILHSYLVSTVLPKVNTDLGSSHLLAHGKQFSTSVGGTLYNRYGSSSGASNNFALSTNQFISALTEIQVYGGIVWSSSGYDTGEADQQLDVFKRYKHTEIFGNESVWLRDIASSLSACYANFAGYAHNGIASNEQYVAGLICFN